MTSPIVSPLGDASLTLTFGSGISKALNEIVVARARILAQAELAGVTDVVPAYAAVTVHYDPEMIGYDDMRRRVMHLLENNDDIGGGIAPTEGRLHRIPVQYDGADLAEVANRTGMPAHDVVSLHSGMEYRVFVTGFVPGFAYLGLLDERLSLPRREAPRKRVSAGSVAIAERQTGVYPADTPGGWHLIGTTSERMFDARRDPPALLGVGDIVRFEPL